MFRIIKVKGDSMSPTLFSGDYVVVFKRYFSSYQIGDIVVLQHNNFGTIIKRVRDKLGTRIFLSGENPASTSSEALGWQHVNSIIGRSVFHIRNRTPLPKGN